MNLYTALHSGRISLTFPPTVQEGSVLSTPYPAFVCRWKPRFWGQVAWVQIPALSLISCVTLNKWLDLSEPQFSSSGKRGCSTHIIDTVRIKWGIWKRLKREPGTWKGLGKCRLLPLEYKPQSETKLTLYASKATLCGLQHMIQLWTWLPYSIVFELAGKFVCGFH